MRSPGSSEKGASRRRPGGMVILYEDQDILVVDKPAGLLTIATDRAEQRTAYFLLNEYVRKGCARSRHRVFIVHRLDRETSGVLVFAKNEASKRVLQEHWDQTEKLYLTMVHGGPTEKEGVISSYLVDTDAYRVYTTHNPALGKLARTAFRVIKQTAGRSLLEIRLLTGRKNQIRVHLAGEGWPVVGDDKYGRPDGERRLALHALSLTIDHPHSGQRMTFQTTPPGFARHLGMQATGGEASGR